MDDVIDELEARTAEGAARASTRAELIRWEGVRALVVKLRALAPASR